MDGALGLENIYSLFQQLQTPSMCQVLNQALRHTITFNPYKSLFGRNHCLYFITDDIEVQHIDVIGPKFMQLGSSGGRI